MPPSPVAQAQEIARRAVLDGRTVSIKGRPPCDLLGLDGRDVGDQAADVGTGGHGQRVARRCTPPKSYPPKRGDAVGLI